MNSRQETKAYEALLESGLAPEDILRQVYEEARSTGESFATILTRRRVVPEVELLNIYSRLFGYPVVSLRKTDIKQEVFTKVPVKLASYYRFFPLKSDGQKLTIAVSRPVDVNYIDEVRFGLNMDVDVVLASEAEIEEMLQKHYGLGADTVDRILTQSPAAGISDASRDHLSSGVEDLEKMADNASVIQLVNQILRDGVRKGASDIHLEPFRGKIRFRYRIDGVLHEASVSPQMKSFFPAMISRIKIMANLNIVERRLPQDGKARVKTQDQTLDLRISSIPTPHGESLVIRILPGQMIREMDELGFDPHQLDLFHKLLSQPHGIIFVTGPTGSGKSTTLYAGLSRMNSTEKKIVTIEDPIEYELEGATQIQVASELGLTFAEGLRSVLRHDPDVMMVGEVRDLETADIAIRVALTGHLILSTLHTNDAASGVTRLLDIGIEPYLISSSVNAFVGQRLIRRICGQCKGISEEVLPGVRDLIRKEASLSDGQDLKIYRGAGCDACNGSGYSGRVAIYEILYMTDEIRHLIFNRASSSEIKQVAIKQGMMTMRQHGWKKVMAGMTTPEEIMNVTPEDAVSGKSEKHVYAAPDSPGIGGPQSESTEEDNLYVNRRAFTRVAVRLKMKYRFIDLSEEGDNDKEDERIYEDAQTEDISANGLSFSLRHEIDPGTALEIRLAIPESESDIQCIGRVVRVVKKLDQGVSGRSFVYLMGVTFLAINSTDRHKMEEFCQRHG